MKFKAKRICPVVAVTAYTDEATYKKAEKVGIKKVINKPVSKDTLYQVLREFYFDKNV